MSQSLTQPTVTGDNTAWQAPRDLEGRSCPSACEMEHEKPRFLLETPFSNLLQQN